MDVLYTYSRIGYEFFDIDTRFYGLREIAVPTNVVAWFPKTITPIVSPESEGPLTLRLNIGNGEVVISDYASLVAINADLALISGWSLIFGDATESQQIIGNTSLNNIDLGVDDLNTVIGTQADADASSDTGTFSLMAFIKRSAVRFTTFLSRIPASLTGSGNFRTAILEPLPTGTNTIGSVTVSGEVEVSNDIGNPIPVTGTLTTTPSGTQDVNIVSSIELEVKNDAGNPVPVNGTVDVGNMPGYAKEAHQSVYALNFGAQGDAAAVTDTGAASYMALFKRLLVQFSAFLTRIPASLTGSGNFRTAILEPLPSGGNTIGDVTVSGEVEVKNDIGNPLAVNITNSIELEVKNDSGSPLNVGIVDGNDVTQGNRADAPASNNTGSWSLIALTKRSLNLLDNIITVLGSGISAISAPSNLPATLAARVNINNLGSVIIAPASPSGKRVFLFVQNKGTGNCWVQLNGGAATIDSILLTPNSSLTLDGTWVPAGIISAFGTAAVHPLHVVYVNTP